MAGGKSLYLADQILNKWLGGAAGASAPATVYVALGTAADWNGLTGEPVGNGYTRVAVTNNTTNWPTTTTGTKSNANAVTFPTASGAWGTLGFMAIYDASTSGNMIYWAPLATAVALGSGQAANFAAGTIPVAEA